MPSPVKYGSGIAYAKPSDKMDLDYHVTSPAKSDVMKKVPSLQTSYRMSVVLKHKDGMGKASLPCIEYRPWGYDPPENQTACGKAYNHM